MWQNGESALETLDGQGLFTAILQSPEDDALRHVYADWLDEVATTSAVSNETWRLTNPQLASAPGVQILLSCLQSHQRRTGLFWIRILAGSIALFARDPGASSSPCSSG